MESGSFDSSFLRESLVEAQNKKLVELENLLKERGEQLWHLVSYSRLLEEEAEYFGVNVGELSQYRHRDGGLRVDPSRIPQLPSGWDSRNLPESFVKYLESLSQRTREASTHCVFPSEQEVMLGAMVEEERAKRAIIEDEMALLKDRLAGRELRVAVLEEMVASLEKDRQEMLIRLGTLRASQIVCDDVHQESIGKTAPDGVGMKRKEEKKEEENELRTELWGLLSSRLKAWKDEINELRAFLDEPDAMDKRLKKLISRMEEWMPTGSEDVKDDE
eukprot:TRINITY_DN8786_c0_g1_i2.p1 TRINITY_DN8786_c0_g1~~TRINITY_DN8786_c0_g1_i2.p1  ORF type:complete len:275 (+),score=86.91 TRINITY_DN8786_c0_g1_i2:161-985(+)